MKDSEIEVLQGMVKGNTLTLRNKEKEVVKLKQKLTRIEGLELASKQRQNLAASQGQLDYFPTTASVPSKGGESTRTRPDVRISSLGKHAKGTKARITLVQIQKAEGMKGSNS